MEGWMDIDDGLLVHSLDSPGSCRMLSLIVHHDAQEMSDAGADVLIVYGIEEGASIMSRAYELKTRLHGVYMTLAPGKSTWAALGDGGNFVVTPGQWSDQAISPCVVFGSVSEYVKIFNGIFAYTPDYNVAMSSFAGVVMQLALQVGALPPLRVTTVD